MLTSSKVIITLSSILPLLLKEGKVGFFFVLLVCVLELKLQNASLRGQFSYRNGQNIFIGVCTLVVCGSTF